MIIFKTIYALQQHLAGLKTGGKSIGFVPTMGALHQGHLSLVEHAQTVCDVVVTSIFVNPTQFNDPTDFEKYPVTIEQDCLKLEKQKNDILFLPSVPEIYPSGIESPAHFDLGTLEILLEGLYRPGHFQGVCQVVNRLLEIVNPNILFLGQKDYQQCKVIQRLVELKNIATDITIVPTIREEDGLAMSSRNVRLSPAQRRVAVAIYQQLSFIKNNIQTQNFEVLIQTANDVLLQAGFAKVDYISIADAETLEPVTVYAKGRKLVGLVAAFLGDVRLIDNLLLN
jgi:pantoate--beta-alanine ligase